MRFLKAIDFNESARSSAEETRGGNQRRAEDSQGDNSVAVLQSFLQQSSLKMDGFHKMWETA